MKRFYSFVVALACTVVGYAQSELVATLNHGDSIAVFYGSEALEKAYEQSTHGDVITLSAGTFNAVDIAKNITVRGAGVEAEGSPTVISGEFRLMHVPDSIDKGHCTFEGIYHDDRLNYGGDGRGNLAPVNNVHFLKCRLSNLSSYMGYSGNDLINAKFLQCKVSKSISLYSDSKAVFINCIVFNPQTSSSSKKSSFEFLNCVVWGETISLGKSVFKNSIIIDKSQDLMPSSCTVSNCLAISGNQDRFFQNIYPANKYKAVAIDEQSSIFKTFTGTYSDTETFELTDDAKATYLGTDDTEVGVYGGNFPFSTVSSLPKIKKFKVASKSDEDGMLSVEIEVSGVK